MQKDQLNRRLRFAPPNPEAKPPSAPKRACLTEADYQLFEVIDRHGPLPSSILYEFTKHLRANRTNFQKRLTELFNGDQGGSYLTKPPQQFANGDARCQHLIYLLAARAMMALGERRATSPPSGSAWFLHQLMQACVGASFELLAPEGIRYVPRSEVLQHDLNTQTRNDWNPLTLPLPNGKTLTPDDLFALEREGKKRFFIVEIDRATESMAGFREEKTTYFTTKLDHYRQVLTNGTIRSRWGFSRPRLLIVTTTEQRQRAILSFLAGQPELAPNVYCTVIPGFTADWRVPKAPFASLYEQPWLTAEGPKLITEA